MHHRLDSRLAVTLASVIASAAVACSAAPAPTTSEQDKAVTTKTPTKSPDASAPPAADTDPTTPTPTAGECSKKADGDACFDCCYAKAPAAYDAVEEVFAACICQAPGACKTDCADSFCGTDATKEPSAACSTCLKANAPTCGPKADAACEASAGCKAVEACARTECAKLDK